MSMATLASEGPSESSSRPATRRAWRRLCYLAATGLVAAATAVSLSQDWAPDPLRPPPRLSLAWWIAPIELHAADRLPWVDADLLDLAADPSGAHVIAVGRRGTVVHSEDGGRTWRREDLIEREPQQQRQQEQQPQSYPEGAPAHPAPNPGPVPDRSKPATGRTGPRKAPEPPGEAGKKAARLDLLEWLVPSARAAEPRAARSRAAGDRDLLAVAIRRWPGDVIALGNQGSTFARDESGWTEAAPWHVGGTFIAAATGPGGTVGLLSSGGFEPALAGASPRLSSARALRVVEDQIFAVVDDRVVVHARGGWRPVGKPTGVALRGLFAASERQLWVVGQGGEILRTTDGGQTWARSTTPAPLPLNAVFFQRDGQRGWRGWIAGNEGYVASSDDGGATFISRTRPRLTSADQAGTPVRLPPPWYGVTWILALGLFFVGRSIPASKEGETELAVTPAFSSDRPLERGDADVLDLAGIAGGLSRFLRNEATTPPLTISITGVWGTGKSSLMNLLRSDLRTFGFHPVWFNAWHHQKEENLLASLLQSIRMQAIPSWWRVEGLLFRVHLLLIRGRKHALLLLALLAAMGLLLANEAGGDHSHELSQTWKLVGEWFKYLIDPAVKEAPKHEGQGMELARISTLLALAFSVFRGLRAFGLNPGTLLASAAGSIKLRDLDAQTSFRERFRGEYAEVTQALGPRKLIIFIDDLDRCQPKQVLEVLEAINFLVTSGECFVILGMDRERVEPAVALSFKDVAAELSGNDDRDGRRKYAVQYLDKLINIEVPVPTLDADHAEQLLAPAAPPAAAEPPPGRWAGVRRGAAEIAGLLRPAARFWPLAVALAALLGGYLGGRWTGRPAATSAPVTAPARAGTAGAAAAPDETVLGPAALSDAARAIADEIAARRPQTGELMAPGGGVFPTTVFLLVLVGGWMIFLLVQMAQLRPEPVVRDSQEFSAALRAWRTLIFATATTPRALKRFQNRVRYLSMRQRHSPETPSLGRLLLGWLTRRKAPSPRPPAGASIPDATLVALAALYQSQPALLTGAVSASQLAAALPTPHPIDPALLAQQVAEHREAFLLRVRGFRVS